MVKENLLEKPKGRIITLSDGKEYTLAPLTLNTLTNLEEAFDCDIEELQSKLAGRSATAFRKLLWAFLREGYPDLKIEKVGELVQLDQMTEVVKELTTALEGLTI